MSSMWKLTGHLLGRLLLWLASTASVLLLLTALLLLVLSYTPEGMERLLQTTARVAGLDLRVDEVAGRLAGPLELRGLRYRDQGMELEVRWLRLQWRPRELFRGTLHVTGLELDEPALRLRQQEAAGPLELPAVALPLRLVLDRAEATGLSITSGDSRRLVERIRLAARLQGERLRLDHLSLAMAGAALEVAGEIRMKGAWPLDLTGRWGYPLPSLERLEGSGEVTGDLRRLRFRQRLRGPLLAGLSGTLTDLTGTPRLRGTLQLRRLGPALAARVAPLDGVHGQLEVEGGTETLTARGELAGRMPDLGTVSSLFRLHWGGSALAIRQLELRSGQGGVLRLGGEWRPGDDGGRIDLTGKWQDLSWPAGGGEPLVSPAGTLELAGGIDDYRLQLAGRLQGAGLPEASLRATARGDRRRLDLPRLRVDLLGGSVDGSGRLEWQPALRGRLQLALAGIDPGVGWPEWPGRLSGDLLLTATGDRFDLRIRDLQGRLRGYPLVLSGGVGLLGGALQLDDLELKSGGSRLQAAGRLSTDSSLRWSLLSDDLASLYPGLTGKLSLNGRLSGDRNRPVLQARIRGSDLAYGDQHLGRIDGDLDLDMAAGDRFRLDLRADGMVLAGRQWRHLQLQGSGNRAAHRLQAELEGAAGGGGLVLAGGLADAMAWSGRLEQLRLQGKAIGEWRLQRPVALRWSGTGGTLERGCLQQAGSGLCLALQWEGGPRWRGDAELSRLALERLRPLLPGDVRVRGAADGRLRFRSDADGALEGEFSLSLPDWQLDYQGDRLLLGASRVTGTLDREGLSLALDLPLGRLGRIDGRARLPGWSTLDPARPQQPLEGRLALRLEELGLLAARFPELSELRGRLDGDLTLAGTLARPRLTGQAVLEASFDLPPLGIGVRDVELTLTSDGGDTLDYRGQARFGDGLLTLTGATRLDPAGGWPTRMRLQGTELLLADIPEAWLLASPDLRLELAADGGRLDGGVVIPRARLRPRSLPETAVSPSADVRLVTGEGKTAAEEGIPLSASVRLRFGDQVSFDGFGLRGLIRGELALREEAGRVATGSGQIRIEEGTYTAYGQDLEIQRGRLLFASSPLSNPGVELVARRRVGEVEVGVRVRGTLRQPRLEVFSRPPMVQSEALAYLLFGGPLNRGASSSDKQRLSSAASALAAGGGGWLAAEIGRQLGLDQLSLQSGGERDLALHMGAWLSPRLYVQYITGLTGSSTNQVRLRYDLTDRLQVETQAGSVQAVDLFYTIER